MPSYQVSGDILKAVLQRSAQTPAKLLLNFFYFYECLIRHFYFLLRFVLNDLIRRWADSITHARDHMRECDAIDNPSCKQHN